MHSTQIIQDFLDLLRSKSFKELIMNDSENKISLSKINSLLDSYLYNSQMNNVFDLYEVLKVINKDFLISIVSCYYSFSEEELGKYKELLPKQYLTKNIVFKEHPDYIELGEYIDEYGEESNGIYSDWDWLSTHYPFNADEIRKYEKDFYVCNSRGFADFYHVGKNPNVIWDYDNFPHFACWAYQLAINTGIKWTVKFIAQNVHQIDGEALIKNPTLPWSEEFINDMKQLFPIWRTTFDSVEKIRNRLDYIEKNRYKIISLNRFYSWNNEIFENHENELDWLKISKNPSIPFSIEFLLKYRMKLRWDNLALNSGVWKKVIKPILSDENSLEALIELHKNNR